MNLRLLNIVSGLLTSKILLLIVLLIFIGSPVVSLSNSIIASNSQLTEEEHSHDDQEEDCDEDAENLFLHSNNLVFVRYFNFAPKIQLECVFLRTLSFDIFLPPPKYA